MNPLSGLDSVFLALEGPTTFMHVGQVSIYDPSTSPRPYSFDRVRDTIAERLPLIPPFRRKVGRLPFRAGAHWVEDADLDIAHHVRRLVLDRPADHRELAAVASKILAEPLDLERPLWQIWVVENLQDGHVATISKVHHAAIDGVAGVEVMAHLLDFEADPAPLEIPAVAGDASESSIGPLLDTLAGLARRPGETARLSGASLRGLADLWRVSRDGGLPPAPFAAPASLLNGPITERRQLAVASVPMDELREVKATLGVTLNDLVLALAGGALRSWLCERNACPDRPLTALMPVSLRAPGEGGFGNQVAVALTSLATEIADPLERLIDISRSARRAKAQTQAVGETLMRWPDVVPSGLVGRATSLYSGLRLAQAHRPAFNVVVSNVPGPDVPLYSAGARMQANFPVGPIYEGVGLNITTMSYCGDMYFGLLACPDVVSDVWAVAHEIENAHRTLQKAAA